MDRIRLMGFASVVFVACTLAAAQQEKGKPADFPPGLFNDGMRYSLADCEGKAVVLFFYEQNCPNCRNLIPQRSALVAQFRDKPVRFFAVAAGDTMQEAAKYVGSTGLAMPTFADALSIMEKRYGMQISMQNIYQFRFYDGSGKLVSYEWNAASVEKALRNAKWKYKDEHDDPKLAPVVELLEWNQHALAIPKLKPLLKNPNKQLAENAGKLYEALKAEATQWKEKADAAVDSDPVTAFDLYTKVQACFAQEDLGKQSAEALKKLKTNKPVVDELAARRLYDQLCAGVSRAKPDQRSAAVEFANGIAKRYPDTPTGKKVAEYLKEIGG
jgi:thiol-disulfide isomerase/thioredoxin